MYCGVNIYLLIVHFLFLPQQGLQAPQHPSSHRTLEALMLTLSQYLATTPMLTTWILQVSVVLLHALPFYLPIGL